MDGKSNSSPADRREPFPDLRKRNERRDRIAARLEAQRKRSIERVMQLRRAYNLRHGG